MNNIEIIKKENGPSGRMYVEKYVKKNYPEIFNNIIEFCGDKLLDLPFKEKVYHYVNDLKENIYCLNPNCNNLVNFKNSTIGYNKYCSNACISSDPKIKKIKEDKSYEKYGTKSPGMNENIKNKMIKTNQERYGCDCSLQNKEIIEKCKNTLLKNYGVDNPNKSEEIILKRVESYSNNMRIKYLEKLKPYGIKDIDYKNKMMYFHCSECNKDFELYLELYHNRKKINTILCTNCNPIATHISGLEIQLQQFIKENYNSIIEFNTNKIIAPYELDIYLPNNKIAIEFNGVHWHSEKYVGNDYHLKKTELCESNDIKLIHIYEDDWMYKNDIVKSNILNILKLTQIIIFANDVEIKEISDNKIIRYFLEKNHIQGFVGSQFKFGLYYNDELVSMITFGKQRKNMGIKSSPDSYELLRFCNKLNTNIIGGESKLFMYFIDNYKPEEIITYADRSWSQGELYYKLGFDFVHKSQSNYYYVVDGIRKNRFEFRKDVLVKDGYDKNKTEHEIMLERKIFRIYDSGQLKFIWKNIK